MDGERAQTLACQSTGAAMLRPYYTLPPLTSFSINAAARGRRAGLQPGGYMSFYASVC